MESLNREFCDFLERHIQNTFANSPDKRVSVMACDGVLEPFMDIEISKKHDTRKSAM
ncbi:MAG: hypothetical protein ABJA70_09620 [Chryseolinea sp.]